MKGIDMNSRVETLLTAKWNSQIGEHEENYFSKINVSRDLDLFPKKFIERFVDKNEGEFFNIEFKKGELFDFSEDNIINLSKKQFSPPKTFLNKRPLIGRFYPLGFFKGLAGVFSSNINPTRIIAINEESSEITIDTNIPIARYDINIEIAIERIIRKSGGAGGECRDWFAIAFQNGPGMQVRFNGIETDFEFENSETFEREDETDDSIFYKEPRLTTHIDSRCNENLLKTYNRILPSKGKLLDLMSSYQSHIPEDKDFHVIGLGLNKEEMKHNNRLHENIIHDLNKNPVLPFSNEEFDVVVCDLSIEYITKPFELISEIRRILKSNGVVTFSFSNRYFPPKVIKIWTDLHDFERVGYVIELLLRNGGFKDFKTFSYRGFSRPFYDKYFTDTLLSDPLYVVYAMKQ
jgi:hypothetical protein